MKTVLTTLLFFGVLFPTCSQTCTYIAYEGFQYNAGIPLQGLSGGSGWLDPWNVQAENLSVPGYQTAHTSASLNYNNLVTLGSKVSGGGVYLTAGRKFDIGVAGPFAGYINSSGGGIGSSQNNDLFFSVLLKKVNNNNENVFISLHGDQIPWYVNNTLPKVDVGYFGNESETGGVKYWSVRIGATVYRTNHPIQINSSALLVLKLAFSNSNTNISFWVNPADIGTSTPPAPAFNQTVNNSNYSIRSLGLYLGDSENNGEVDEIRFADSYQCVTPVPGTLLNAPPTAIINTDVISGKIPFTVSFDGTASSDPEHSSLTYVWDFGDGSPTQTGATATHTYSVLGQVQASLTVRDDLNQKHTQYQTITGLDPHGTFSCQSTFSVLNMPGCNANDGRVIINVTNASFELRNSQNILMSASNTNEFHNLAAGAYTFTASGITTACKDTFKLYLQTDSTTCSAWQAPVCAMELGINIDGLADWSAIRAFKNLMKHVRGEPIPFIINGAWSVDVLSEMSFDVNGYPTYLPQNTSAGSTALRYMLSSEGGNLHIGENYVFLYEGAGTLEFKGGVNIISSSVGRIVFSVTNNGNIWFDLFVSQAENHIRNIRILRLSDENIDTTTDIFYQVFLDKLTPFKMLRFMDWGATNGNPTVNWADRKGLNYFTFATASGVPYEMMIALANKTQKDVWICVPHLASDDYVTQMALMFKNKLNPNLKVYLEYSNEVWNWIFAQAHYNDQNRPNNLNYGRAYAEKAKRIFRIWHQVFDTQKSRVKRVLGIQGQFNYLNQQILCQLNQNEWDMGSPSHYFGLDHTNTATPVLNAGSTPADVMLNAQNNWNASKPLIKNDFDLIKLLGKEVVTYEGGQHFVGNVFGMPYPYQQAMWNAQYSLQMYTMYNEVLETIRNWGCKVAGNFSMAGVQESVYGSWGAMSSLETQPPYLTTAPKYQAMIDNVGNCLCPNQKTVNDKPIDTGIYQALNTLQSAGSVKAGDNILFKAGNSILLKPGFLLETGSIFNARIGACNE